MRGILAAASEGLDVVMAPQREAFFCGIDPGLHGFSAIIDSRGEIVDTFPTPTTSGDKQHEYDVAALWQMVAAWRGYVTYAVIERQQPYPDQSFSNFATGDGWGLWRMALCVAGIPYEALYPATWKSQFQIRAVRDPDDDTVIVTEKDKQRRKRERQKMAKSIAIAVATRLYPRYDFRLNERCRVPHDGKAEAVLLATLAKRRYGGR